MAGVGPSGNCPRWTMCRATCLNKLGSVMLKSIREGHLPHGTRPGSKTDGLGHAGSRQQSERRPPDASGRSLGAKLAPQSQKGAMGEQFSQLNHPSHRSPRSPRSPLTAITGAALTRNHPHLSLPSATVPVTTTRHQASSPRGTKRSIGARSKASLATVCGLGHGRMPR